MEYCVMQIGIQDNVLAVFGAFESEIVADNWAMEQVWPVGSKYIVAPVFHRDTEPVRRTPLLLPIGSGGYTLETLPF